MCPSSGRTPLGLRPAVEERDPLSKVTELASSQITATEAITVELIEADETPAVVIVRWPIKPPCCIRTGFPPLPIPLPVSLLLPRYGWHRSGGGVISDHRTRWFDNFSGDVCVKLVATCRARHRRTRP
jgi:hypothetical protein